MAFFPELFELARKLRESGATVRIHSLRVGDIDDDGNGGEKVVVRSDDGQV